jgi:hypothetical protein
VTILQSIQQANTEAGIRALSFANLQEFNAFMDSFNFEDWPRNVVVPPVVNGTFNGIKAAETLVLRGWVLRRIPEDTNDWRSVQLEPDYISPMRDFARKFVRKMLDSDIVDPSRDPASYTITPEYMFLNQHLFGVSYQAQIPIMKNVC